MQNKKKKEWNVMVFMAGDNNLTEEMLWGLQEMKLANTMLIDESQPNGRKLRDAVNVIAQYDPRGGNPRRYDFTSPNPQEGDDPLSKYKIEELTPQQLRKLLKTKIKDTNAHQTIAGKFIKCEPTLSISAKEKMVHASLELLQSDKHLKARMGELSSQMMVEDFVVKEHERLKDDDLLADKYLVVLSGHGGGAVGDFLPDDDPKSALSIPKLRKALKTAHDKLGKKIDVLGMESCMMSMAEVCYELQGDVRYLVGAEGFVKNTGWPYQQVLDALAKTVRNRRQTKSLAVDIVKRYVQFYRDYDVAGVSVDLAAIDLEKMGKAVEVQRTSKKCNLPTLIRLLATNLTTILVEGLDEQEEYFELSGEKPHHAAARSIRDAIILAHWYAQSYKREQYVDLYDFCDQLNRFLHTTGLSKRTRTNHREIIKRIKTCCAAIKNKIEDIVLISCHWGARFQHSHGLSIYFPWSASRYAPEYRHLKFATDTGWAKFLEAYLLATLRLRRDQADHLTDGSMEKPERSVPSRRIEFLLKSTERFTEIGSPRDSEIGTDMDSEIGTDMDSEIGTDMDSEIGTDMDSEIGTDMDSEIGTDMDSEIGTDMDSEIGTDMDSEIGTDMGTKLGIASMKNPADGFYEPECPDSKKKKKKARPRK